MASDEENAPSAKLVTFLGKGGSGKTLSSIFAAQVPYTCSLSFSFISIDMDFKKKKKRG